MQTVTRTSTNATQTVSSYRNLIALGPDTENNIVPPKGTSKIVKILASVSNATADPYCSIIEISGSSFPSQTIMGPSASSDTSGMTQSDLSIPLGSGFDLGESNSLNVKYMQLSSGNLTQNVVVTLFFE